MNTKNNELAAVKSEKGMIAVAENFLHNNGEIVIPPNYDVSGAVKSLYLMTLDTKDKQGRPALEVCTEQSIKQCVMQLVSKGLNPDKKQCYPIVYGTQLQLQVGSYGAVKQAKAVADIEEINANIIRDGDKVDVSYDKKGRLQVKHSTSWANQSKPITGAYATAVYADGSTLSDIMTIAEIRISWSKSKSGGSVHKEFPAEMAKKTVKSRLAKHIINTSDDSVKMQVQSLLGEDYEEQEEQATVKMAEITPLDEQEEQAIIIDVDTETGEVIESEVVIEEVENPFEEEQEQGEWIEIMYGEYKENKEMYEMQKGSYDTNTKTCKVRKIN